mmetsp:Transcript_45274/g.75563  ORF Transcript_45274/g.75563 Transcript_45274/m.75563 type:complete len:356 (+) Transcript_45274:327-1394(+)
MGSCTSSPAVAAPPQTTSVVTVTKTETTPVKIEEPVKPVVVPVADIPTPAPVTPAPVPVVEIPTPAPVAPAAVPVEDLVADEQVREVTPTPLADKFISPVSTLLIGDEVPRIEPTAFFGAPGAVQSFPDTNAPPSSPHPQEVIAEAPVVVAAAAAVPTVVAAPEPAIVEAPVAEVPKVEAPIVVVPEIKTPVIETPAVEVPTVEVPKVEVPKVEVPTVEVPAVEVPAVEVPSVAVLAAVEVPAVGVPAVVAPAVEEPKVEVPEVKATPDPAVVLDKLRAALKARGAEGIKGVSRHFAILDDDISGTLSPAEFAEEIRMNNLDLTPEESDALFKHLDVDGSGSVSYFEYVKAIRGV